MEIREIIGNTTTTPNPQSDWNQHDETKPDYIKNKPTILTEEDVNDLVSQHGGQFVQVQSDWNQTDTTKVDFIKNKPQIPEVKPQVQSDWSQMDETKPDYIKNKTHHDEFYGQSAVFTWSDPTDPIEDGGDQLEVIPGKKYKFVVSQEVYHNGITIQQVLCEVYDTFVENGKEGYHHFQVNATSVEGHALHMEHDGSDLGPERLILHGEHNTPIALTVYELMPAKQLDPKFIPTDNNTIVTKDGVLRVNSDLFASKSDIGDISTALDRIIAIQNALIGGDS